MPRLGPMAPEEMKRAFLLLGLLLALSGAVAGTVHASDATPATTERLQALDGQILTRLNAARAAHGLRPLAVSNELENAAVAHSRELIQAGVFQHDSPDGTSFVQRLKHFYSPSGYASWTAGENILYNTADIDADTAIQAWLDSPPHRENMLDPDWREVGIGSVHASERRRHVRRRSHLGDHDGFRRAHRRCQGCDEGARQLQVMAAHKKATAQKAAKKPARAKLKKAKQHTAGLAKKPAAKPKPKQQAKRQGEAEGQAEVAGTAPLGWRAARAPRRSRARPGRRCSRRRRVRSPSRRGRGRRTRRRRTRSRAAAGRCAGARSRAVERPRPLRGRGTASPAGRC